MKSLSAMAFVALIGLAGPAFAEFEQVTKRADFLALVQGKKLTRPLVKLQLLPDGRISGTGATREVTGNWTWQNGYLCRSLFWGGDDLGYNCQEVKSDGKRLRITSDKGRGDSAEFRLR